LALRRTDTTTPPRSGGVAAFRILGAASLAVAALGLPSVQAQTSAPPVYRIVDGGIAEPLTSTPGDPVRGRAIAASRGAGHCIVCHAMPIPEEPFHGTVGPDLAGVGNRWSVPELRLRVVDSKALNPETAMPAYFKVDGLLRVARSRVGMPVLSAQQIEDLVAYLATLR
jgi:sulfur-oxidizing protein SoxX